MGNKTNQSKNKLAKFNQEELETIKSLYSKFITSNGIFDLVQFEKDLFQGTHTQTIFFLNDFYKGNGADMKIDNLTQYDLTTLAYVLVGISQDEENNIRCYYKAHTFFILYDILTGKVGSFNKRDDNSNQSFMDFEIVLNLFELIVKIYISKHEQAQAIIYERDSLSKYLRSNLNLSNDTKTVSYTAISDFINHQLYNLDAFLKSYFREKFLNKNSGLLTNIPICTELSSTLSIEQFLFFTLSNPHVYSKSYAFKLFDCRKNGYNIPNLIYSFLGFGGPVAIFINHYHKETDTDHVLGAFLNSNLKESFEAFSGDDLSFIFTIRPKLHFYKYAGKENKICYINSKNQRFSKKEPGIGLGNYNDRFRLWIDSNECFKKSYFMKYDDVFDEGSPFEEVDQHLNVIVPSKI